MSAVKFPEVVKYQKHDKMKILTVYISVLLLFLVTAGNISAQDTKIINDTVFHKDTARLVMEVKTIREGTGYTIRTPDSVMQAIFTLVGKKDSLFFTARFIAGGMMYSRFYPKFDIEQVLDEYFSAGIFKEGKTDTLALANYCKEKNILVKRMPPRKPTPGKVLSPEDSLKRAQHLQRFNERIETLVSNRSKSAVTLFVSDSSNVFMTNVTKGLKPVRNGRTITVPSEGEMRIISFKDEIICIQDAAANVKSCHVPRKEISAIYIKSNGEEFEK